MYYQNVEFYLVCGTEFSKNNHDCLSIDMMVLKCETFWYRYWERQNEYMLEKSSNSLNIKLQGAIVVVNILPCIWDILHVCVKYVWFIFIKHKPNRHNDMVFDVTLKCALTFMFIGNHNLFNLNRNCLFDAVRHLGLVILYSDLSLHRKSGSAMNFAMNRCGFP